MSPLPLVDRYPTLVDALRARAEHAPDSVGWRHLVDGSVDGPVDERTFAQFERSVRSVAAHLQREVSPGARLLLLYPPGLEFPVAFFAAQFAGAIPVPVFPPDPSGLEKSLERIRAIARDCGPEMVLSTREILGLAQGLLGADPLVNELPWVATDDLPDTSDAWRAPAIDGDTVALLQYTSGSTGAPRGVVVRHRQVVANLSQIRHEMGSGDRTSLVSWLPHYHDMGLTSGVFHPLMAGGQSTLLSPLAFLQRPSRWLQAVTRYRGTVTGGPNFGFDLCVRKVTDAELDTLDLSSLEVVFDGAEPIRADTLEAFAARFERCGLRREALFPCYGLAEATLYLTGAGHRRGPTTLQASGAAGMGARVLQGAPDRVWVSSGAPPADVEVRVVDADGKPVPDGVVGEVWARGPNVAKEYWNKGPESRRTFRNRLDGREDDFLRTGDLAFLHEGQLYVTGRIKDLLILNGRNVYPTDLERDVERLAGIRAGCVAAVSVPWGGSEGAVVLAEVARTASPAPDLVEHVRQVLAERHQVVPVAVVLVAQGALPKTSSGKLQRYACRDAFLDGSLQALADWRDAPAAVAEGPTLYEDLPERFARLDRRETRYRFDLETAVPWDRLDAPGAFLGGYVLRDRGLDTIYAALPPERRDLLEWLFAVHISMHFEHLERVLIAFCRRERTALGATRSLDLLDEEEVKHIEAFARFREHLLARRPELRPRMARQKERYWDDIRRFFTSAHEDPRRRHYVMWLLVLLFEENTLYYPKHLATDADGIQPAWFALHQAHAAEEAQHVLTDAAYLDALVVTEEERFEWSRQIFQDLLANFDELFTPWWGLFRELCPEVSDSPPYAPGRHPLYTMLADRCFTRSVAAAPYFAHVLRLAGSDRDPTLARAKPGTAASPERYAELHAWISRWVAREIAPAPVDPRATFTRLGLDSVRIVSLSGDLEQFAQRRFPTTVAHDHPTISALAAHAAQVEVATVPTPSTVRPGPLRANARQERLWRLMRANPGQVLDHVTEVYEVDPTDDVTAALRVLGARHELLRSCFRGLPGEGGLYVHPTIDVVVREVRADGDWEAAVAREALAEENRPFDPAEAPLWRAVRVAGDGRCALVLTVCHIVTDGWSANVLRAELGRLLHAARAGRPAELPPLPLQPPDVAAREVAWTASPEVAEHLAWWRQRLAGHPRLSEPGRGTFQAGRVRRTVPAATAKALARVASRAGVSPYVAMLATFVRCYQRRCERDDVLVNTHLFNRRTEAERAMVGYFVNLLTLRATTDRDAPAAEALRATHLGWLDALEHAVPIDHLVRELAPERYLERWMPGRVAFNLLPAPSRTAPSVPLLSDFAPPPAFLFFDEMTVVSSGANGDLAVTAWHDEGAVPRHDAQAHLDDFCEALAGLAREG